MADHYRLSVVHEHNGSEENNVSFSVWSQAACHRDNSIAKKAVQCIHEVVTTLLSTETELPYFHFHESLCKPFENLLCLELCDGDTQDQVWTGGEIWINWFEVSPSGALKQS